MKNIIVKTTPAFDRKVEKLMTQEAQEGLFDYLEKYPGAGDIIQGTRGIRKLRWRTGKNSKGKSGGVRVLYYYSKHILVLIISLYPKSEQENITHAEKNELKKMLPLLIKKYSEDL
jgi:hypothetical protein